VASAGSWSSAACGRARGRPASSAPRGEREGWKLVVDEFFVGVDDVPACPGAKGERPRAAPYRPSSPPPGRSPNAEPPNLRTFEPPTGERARLWSRYDGPAGRRAAARALGCAKDAPNTPILGRFASNGDGGGYRRAGSVRRWSCSGQAARVGPGGARGMYAETVTFQDTAAGARGQGRGMAMNRPPRQALPDAALRGIRAAQAGGRDLPDWRPVLCAPCRSRARRT
jgi:hypothetical protein